MYQKPVMKQNSSKSWIGKNYWKDTPRLNEKIFLTFDKAMVEIFAGIRGSGKSYAANVRLEEQLKARTRQSILVFDPMGIYAGLKFPNQNSNELKGWDIKPFSFNTKVQVLVPKGSTIIPSYADGEFSLSPAQLDPVIWCDIFDIKPFSPMANAFSQLYSFESEHLSSIDKMLFLLDQLASEGSINTNTLEAVKSRLNSAKYWNFFDNQGRLEDLVQKGICTIFDMKYINTHVQRAIISFFLYKILQKRIQQVSEYQMAKLQGLKATAPSIPAVTVLLEEAHRYQKLHALQEFIRMGRSPGLSAILVTQEPETLDKTVVQQPGRIYCFQMTHKDAITNIQKIASLAPPSFKGAVKHLQVGECFYFEHGKSAIQKIKIRPRHSAHIAQTEINPEED